MVGGVHKRVDENRELLELLHAKAPKLLNDCPWVVGWIQSNDEFFTALEGLSGPLGATNQQFSMRSGFPRPWPELPAKNTAPDSWIAHAYPLQQITIQLQGTKHSDRSNIISQLETVLTRLRTGDMKGQDHDDDFGYSFAVEEASAGPSFFDDPAGSN